MNVNILCGAVFIASFALVGMAGLAVAQEAADATASLEKHQEEGGGSENNPVLAFSAAAPPRGWSAMTELETVTVTGTRIRGGTMPSPVITIGSENIREEGFTELGEVIRSVPQNFSGGQNPGVSAGATGGGLANQNITGGSGLNLRGLGQDASLTLLNGRRMSYGGFVQMVDVSAIPVEAVDRLEIVADGASAIYGSDAVGGVANVILKRGYDGVTASMRYAAATGGGLATREATVTTGTRWPSGGVLMTLKRTLGDPVRSDQRSYTEAMYRPSTLYQGSGLGSGLLSAYQSLGELAELRFDALKTERRILTDLAYLTTYERYEPETTTVLVSPAMDLWLPNGWMLSVGATRGEDTTETSRRVVTLATGATTLSRSMYDNSSRTYEIGAEGPLFALAGGDARLAVGAGYRSNEFRQVNLVSGNVAVDGSVESRFAYAEASLPLIGEPAPAGAPRGLELTAAVRGEEYDSFGGVTTPKLGVVYRSGGDITLKGSWGRSFKVPTLLQQYQARNAYLFPASAMGGSGYASEASVLYLFGGNPDLNPERATTRSASLAIHPVSIPKLEAELTLFDVDYTNRVVQPLVPGEALSNPVFDGFLVRSPTAAVQAQAIASYNFVNVTGAPYDPGNVVAIAPNIYVNAARERARGVDLSALYRIDLAASNLTVRGAASWLDSKRRTVEGAAAHALSGTLFHPAKFNGRLGAVWSGQGFSTALFGNHRSGVINPADERKGGSFTTFDATVRYDFREGRANMPGFAIDVTAQNALDRAPPLYATTSLTNAPYDSLNYQATGRFLSLSVSMRW